MRNCERVIGMLHLQPQCCRECHNYKETYGYGLMEVWVRGQRAAG